MKYLFLLFFCVIFDVWVSSCSCNSAKPDCYYNPSERVLYLDDTNYKFIAMKINVYSKPDKDGEFERVELHFKENVSVRSVDFDIVDTIVLCEIDSLSLVKIKEAKSISIPFIYINKTIDVKSIDEIRALVNIDKSQPLTKCEVVRL